MVTINHLDVQFDVEGTDEKRLFEQYFDERIEQWSRARDEKRQLRETMERNRGLGDRDSGQRYR